jgi:sugar-phosphatase
MDLGFRFMTMQVSCSAFLFDLDGVLVDSRAVVERTCRRWALRHHLDPEKVLRIAHGRRTRDTVQAAAPHLETDREELRLTSVGLPIPAVLVTSEDVSRGKPAPDGYRLGAQRLGLDPAACVVFEDAPAGITAGRDAGARVIALTTMLAARDLEGADATIADFTAIRVRQEQHGFVVTTR